MSDTVSNELLHRAFSIFGPVEKANILVDDGGVKSKGVGVVEFASKTAAQEALLACKEGMFVLTTSLIPVSVEPYEVISFF